MGLPSYIINFDELADLLEMQLEGEDKTRRAEQFDGEIKTKSFKADIPPLENRYIILDWKPTKDIKLTSVKFSQTAWKGEDSWDLYLRNEPMFIDIYTKELADRKHWEVIENIDSGDNIQLFLENRSGNHRQVWVDLEYIEMWGS